MSMFGQLLDAATKRWADWLSTNGAAHVTLVGGYAGPRGLTGQAVAIGAASAQSTPVTGSLVDVTATVACFLAIGANPTAAASTGYYLAANTTYRLPITSGDKIAVIQASSAGTLYVHPVA